MKELHPATILDLAKRGYRKPHEKTKENLRTSVRVTGVPAKIRNEKIANISQLVML
jgi:hypothetical protein